jgi:hypothetical protein
MVCQRRSAGLTYAHILGQSKIQNLDAAIGGNHHIGGLQIAMYDTLFVCRGDCVGKFTGDFDHLRDRETARRDQVVQREPFDKFHRQEMNAAGFFHRINGDDVRVVERRNCSRFALESRQAIRIARHVCRQYFQSYFAAEFCVRRTIHLARATRTDLSTMR